MDKIITLPKIEKYSSRKEWEDACWNKILESNELKELLKLFTTSHERHDLITRIAALEKITSGKSYRKIGDELWLSSQTISGIKKAINENGYRSYLERSKKERKKKVYSHDRASSTKPKPKGRAHKTKYGTIYSEYF